MVTFAQQDTGQINGVVKDPNGAVVAGATVKATNANTGATRTATTNSDGYFVLVNLLPAEYTVTVSSTGFKDNVTKTLVSVSGVSTVNVSLNVQGTADVVDVVAGTGGIAEVDTTTQSQSTAITQRDIQKLPTGDRNPYGLVGLAGNVSGADPDGRGAGYAINGQRSASTAILLDGGENAATFTQTVSQTIPQDAVGEFRVLTSNFSAEFGRASGGVVNVSTKSGTNRFQGSVFEYNRNSYVSANGFDNNARGNNRPHYNRNQFGGTVSGPIIKDKLLYFDSIELTRVRSTATNTVWVPTTTFLASSAANTQAFFSTYGTLSARPNGVVSADNRFRQVVYDSPGDSGGGTPQNTWNNVARVDWNYSDKTTMFFSYKASNEDFLPGTVASSPWAGYTAGSKQFNQNFQGTVVHNFSSNLIFDGKVTYRRAKGTVSLGAKSPNTPTLYWFDQAVPSLDGLCIAFPGYLPCSPGAGLPAPELEQMWDVKPNATWIYGNHNVRFGGQYVHLSDDTVFGAYQNASEGFSGANYAQAAANFVTGTLVRFQVAVDPQGKYPGSLINLPAKAPNFERTNKYNEFALYANDAWRIVPNVTLNLGVRYEFYGPQKSKEGLDSNFYFGTGSNIYQQIRSGFAGPASANGGLWKSQKNNWAPRIGFAWDIFGDGKTSLRGGYGIGYERNFGNVTFNVIQNPPYYAVLSVPGTVTVNNFGPLAGSSGTAQLPRTSLRAVDPNIKTAYAHQWGITFEREISKNTVAKLDYSGSAGRDLYSISNINRSGTGTYYLGSIATTGCNGLAATDRLNCQYSNINFRGSDGTSNYYSFTPALESTNLFGTGIVLTARYTYSSTKDNLSSTFSSSGNNFNLGYLDPFNPMYDYGSADFDVRHRFVASYSYEVPFKGDNKVVRNIFGGWNVGGTLNIQSGSPFTIWDVTSCNITTCWRLLNGARITTNSLNSVDTGSANLFEYITFTGGPTASDIFGNNEVGPYPSNMMKRNAFRGPGGWNTYISLFKEVKINERYSLQFRVDALNLFNHANTYVDGANAYGFDSGSGVEGSVNTYKAGKRDVQFSFYFKF
jgi:hypothetical protein